MKRERRTEAVAIQQYEVTGVCSLTETTAVVVVQYERVAPAKARQGIQQYLRIR